MFPQIIGVTRPMRTRTVERVHIETGEPRLPSYSCSPYNVRVAEILASVAATGSSEKRMSVPAEVIRK